MLPSQVLAAGLLVTICGMAQRSWAMTPDASLADPRLRVPISLRELYLPVEELLGQTSERVRLPLHTVDHLRRRRHHVLCKARPISEVMAALADVTMTRPGTTRWVPGGVPPRSYTLRPDLLCQETERRLQRERSTELRSRIAQAVAAGSLSDEEHRNLSSTNPRLAHASPTMIRLVAEFSPGLWDAVLRGERQMIPYAQLTLRQQAIVRQTWRGVFSTTSTKASDGTRVVTGTFDGDRDYPLTKVEFRLSGIPQRPSLWVMMRHTLDGGSGAPNFLGLPGRVHPSLPKWLQDAIETEQTTWRKAHSPANTTDPVLQQRVTIQQQFVEPSDGKQRTTTLGGALLQIHEQTGIPILAHGDPGFDDYYRRSGGRMLHEPIENARVWEALQQVGERWRVTWEWKRGWILVRSLNVVLGERDGLDLTPIWLDQPKPKGETSPAPAR